MQKWTATRRLAATLARRLQHIRAVVAIGTTSIVVLPRLDLVRSIANWPNDGTGGSELRR